jgi:hypothetical protein
MVDEIAQIKGIVGDYLKKIKNLDSFVIIFARRDNGNWKVVVRYSTSDNPDTMSMLLINRTTMQVDYFRENIQTY